MPESASHAPGHEVTGEGGAVRQRYRMGKGESAMGGETFGVGPLPGTHIAQNHGVHAEHEGMVLADDARAGPPAIRNGDDLLHSTAHSNHGPHGHSHKMHDHAPKGHRPHHVGKHHKR